MKFKFLKAAFAGLVLTVSGLANAGLITYTDWTEFDSLTFGLTIENFEVGLGNSGVSGVGSIINSATNTGPITTGEISSGFNLTSIQGGEMVALGAGIGGLTSNGVAVDLFSEEMRLDLLSPFTAVGFDLLNTATGTVEAQFFNANSLLGTLILPVSNVLNFGGAIAFGGDIITRVDFVNEIPSEQGIIMDRLAFGTTSVPEPSTLAIFALGLISLASRRFKKHS